MHDIGKMKNTISNHFQTLLPMLMDKVGHSAQNFPLPLLRHAVDCMFVSPKFICETLIILGRC